MPDREKVIKGLEYCKEYFNCCDKCPYWDRGTQCMPDLANEVLILLKEQEAVTVESIQISRNFYAELTGYCPSCKRPLKDQFNKYFCGNCGRAVKWE